MIGKTRSDQMVFFGVRQTSVSAAGIVVAMRSLLPLLRKVEFAKNNNKKKYLMALDQ